MRMIRGGGILGEGQLLCFNVLACKGYSIDKKVLKKNKYTIALSASFSDTELNEILRYDNERKKDNEKIILGTFRFNNNDNIINPINLKGAVKSGLITKLEIDARQGNSNYLFQSPALDLIGDCAFKSLHITTDISFILTPSGVDDIIMLINRYKGTLDQLELHFGTVGMTILSKIYEGVENWIINTPITVNASLTAECINYKPIKSRQQSDSLYERLDQIVHNAEYDNMQKKLQFLIDCKRFSECFKTTKEKEERDVLCAKIINNNPEFTKNFNEFRNCIHSKIKKVIGGDDIYNTFQRYCIDNGIIPDDTSEYSMYCIDMLKDTREEIDDSGENSNSATEDDVNLTTSGTTADRGDGCIIS